MNNRIPIAILVALVLIALIYRIVNPPAPIPPGPRGQIPSWRSMSKVGNMGPWQVGPSGKMWAGAWNVEEKDGKPRSAIWVIDLEKPEAKLYKIEGKAKTANLSWTNDNTVQALVTNNYSKMVSINTADGKLSEGKPIGTKITQIPAWPAGSKNFAAAKDNVIYILSDDGNEIGKEISIPAAKDVKYGPTGAVSADGTLGVISTIEDEVGAKMSYYLVNATDGTSKRIFGSKELPGRVEGIWVSPAGVLVVCSERDEFDRVVYDITSGKLQEVKSGQKLDLASWPYAPRNMMFVSYSAGYKLALANGKSTKLFGLENLRRSDSYWRSEVQGGRLYPRADGSYTSVSLAAGAIDIRTIEKDGSKGKDILPRM